MMSSPPFSLVPLLAIVLLMAHAMGHLCVWLRQPRMIGEILTGVLLGPWVFGQLPGGLSRMLFPAPDAVSDPTGNILGFGAWLGMMLLMFVSGSETRNVLSNENRTPTAWVLTVGTAIPFLLVFAFGSLAPLELMTGPRSNGLAIRLLLAVAVTVTSIPVISRILQDLGIMKTRFASLVVGAAILDDIILWAVLALATAAAKFPDLHLQNVPWSILQEALTTLAFLAFGFLVAPSLLQRLHGARWNVVERSTPIGYALCVMLFYAAVGSALQVNAVLAAFLAGFGFVGGMSGKSRERYAASLDAIWRFAFASFIPLYFVVVGYRLQLGETFSLHLLVGFLVISSLIRVVGVACATFMAGFRGGDVVNLSVAFNARGGPGIVMATIAYEAGMINGNMFTVLTLTAILTSQFAGFWLDKDLRRGWSPECVVVPEKRQPLLGTVGTDD